MADAVVDETTNTEETEVKDEATEQAALESRIDEELAKDGINVPKPKEEAKDEVADDSKDGQDDASDEAGDTGDADGDGDVADSDVADDEDSADTKDESTAELATNPEFSFEVEDANGKSYKITKIEDLPQDFEPKNNRQVMEIIAQANKLESDIAKHEQDQAEAEEKSITESAQKEILKGWEGEIGQLVEEKLLSKPKLASNNPKYAEDPAVVKIDAVYKFISDTNTARKAAGNPNMLTSFRDAFEIMELRGQQAKASDASKKEANLAKTKAGVIGTTSTASTDAPVYLAGSYRSMDDIPT